MLKLNFIERIRLYFAKKHNVEGNFWCEMEIKYLRKWSKSKNIEYVRLSNICNFKACQAYRELLRKYHLDIA